MKRKIGASCLGRVQSMCEGTGLAHSGVALTQVGFTPVYEIQAVYGQANSLRTHDVAFDCSASIGLNRLD